jgi:hypothetical protein
MSLGDANRRDEHVARMRAELRAESDKLLIFKPQVTQKPVPGYEPPVVPATLKLLEDPSFFLKREADKKQEKENKRKQAVEEKEAKELAQCTFSPQPSRGPPGFVKQMAETYRSVRRLESSDKAQSAKPDWR